MSHSPLAKTIFSKKIKQDYIFILYKQQYKNRKSEITTLHICNNYDRVLHTIVNYYVNEFYGTTIISPLLLKHLNSRRHIQSKYKSIILELNNIFKDNEKIFEYKFKIIHKNNYLLLNFFENKLQQQNNIQQLYTLKHYNHFYRTYNNFSKYLSPIHHIRKKLKK